MRPKPDAVVDLAGRIRTALGDTYTTLSELAPQEQANPGSTNYPLLVAALIDRGWPPLALARVLPDDYATLSGYHAAYTRKGPTGKVPAFPKEIIYDLRNARNGSPMDDEVAEFVRRIDGAAVGHYGSFIEAGGTEEQFEQLQNTYMRYGLYAIGAEALRRERLRGVSWRAMERRLCRPQSKLRARLSYRMDAEHGWAIMEGRTAIERRRRYIHREDAERYADTEGGRYGAITIPGKPLIMSEVPTSPYQR